MHEEGSFLLILAHNETFFMHSLPSSISIISIFLAHRPNPEGTTICHKICFYLVLNTALQLQHFRSNHQNFKLFTRHHYKLNFTIT